MDPFATPAELATYLQTATQAEADAGSGDVLDTSVALQALAAASDAIRAACGWGITQETVTASVSMASRGSVFLPTLHLTAVSMSVNSTPLADGVDFTWETNGLLRSTHGPFWFATAAVTYTHGYATVPDSIKNLCLERAARQYVNPEGLVSSTVDGITGVYQSRADDWSFDPRLAPYKLPVVG